MADVSVQVEDISEEPPATEESESQPSDERVSEALAANDAEHAAEEAEEAQGEAEAAAEASVGAATASVMTAEIIAEQLAETRALVEDTRALIAEHANLIAMQQQSQITELGPVETPPVQQDTAPDNQHFLTRRWWGNK